MPSLEKLCQTVVVRNDQANLRPTLNKEARDKSLTIFVTDCRSAVSVLCIIALKVSKYGVFSGPNTGKYGPEITPSLHTFHAVHLSRREEQINTAYGK